MPVSNWNPPKSGIPMRETRARYTRLKKIPLRAQVREISEVDFSPPVADDQLVAHGAVAEFCADEHRTKAAMTMPGNATKPDTPKLLRKSESMGICTSFISMLRQPATIVNIAYKIVKSSEILHTISFFIRLKFAINNLFTASTSDQSHIVAFQTFISFVNRVDFAAFFLREPKSVL